MRLREVGFEFDRSLKLANRRVKFSFGLQHPAQRVVRFGARGSKAQNFVERGFRSRQVTTLQRLHSLRVNLFDLRRRLALLGRAEHSRRPERRQRREEKGQERPSAAKPKPYWNDRNLQQIPHHISDRNSSTLMKRAWS